MQHTKPNVPMFLCDVCVCLCMRYLHVAIDTWGWLKLLIYIDYGMLEYSVSFFRGRALLGGFICNTRRRAVAENRSAAYLEQNKATPNRCNLIKIFARTCSLAYFNRIYCHLIVARLPFFFAFSLLHTALGLHVSTYISGDSHVLTLFLCGYRVAKMNIEICIHNWHLAHT